MELKETRRMAAKAGGAIPSTEQALKRRGRSLRALDAARVAARRGVGHGERGNGVERLSEDSVVCSRILHRRASIMATTREGTCKKEAKGGHRLSSNSH